MSEEFKLSYTANEINERLSRIDSLAEKSELPKNTSDLINDSGYLTEHQSLEGLVTQEYMEEALATKQPLGDYALKSDIPDVGAGGSAIIDVVELPSTDINENAFYRLATAKFVYSGGIIDGWTCHYVNELPSVGEPVSTDMENITAYYNAQDGEVYGYADEMISAAGGVPVGWYPIGVLGQAFDVAWGGVITDAEQVGDSTNVLLNKDYYTYKNGWTKLIYAEEKPPKFDLTWDGEIGDRFALDMSMLGYDAGTYFVKVSDEVLSVEDVIGGTYEYYLDSDSYFNVAEINEYSIDEESFPGAFSINTYAVVVHDEETLATALGLPSGYITNGVYYLLIVDEIHLVRLTTPAKVSKKIDSKYLDVHDVAISGSYYDLSNTPTIYTDVVRYNNTQSLSSTQKSRARTNIDVYSKSEVDNKIANLNVNVDLSAYAKTTDVESMISAAIGTAIGGSY